MLRSRRYVLLVAFLQLPALMLFTLGAGADPPGSCDGSRHFYALATSTDIGNADGDASSAGWEEQNFVVYDFGSMGFGYSGMWVTPECCPNDWVEIGFIRWSGCVKPGDYCWIRTKAVNGSIVAQTELSKSPQGTHTWHVHKLQYNSSNGIYYSYIDGVQYGGFSQSRTASYVDIGHEISNSCTTAHITYWGDASPSSSRAFQYRTSWGQWTTWGSGSIGADHPPMHIEWLTYAIRMRTWGP